MKYIFIINKTAGNGKFQTKQLEDLVISSAKKANIEKDVSCYFTSAPNDSINYIASLDAQNGPYTIIACGGDGTLKEVVNGIMKRSDSSDIRIGIIPCGTGNDFVKSFTNNENFLNIEEQFNSNIHEIDVIKVDDDYCINLANMGFDANVANNMNKYKKKFGKFSYQIALLRELFLPAKFPMTIEFDDNTKLEGDYILLSIANGVAYGGGFYAAPLSSMTDGVMDICYCDMISKLRLITVIGDYKAGKHFSGKYDNFIHRKTAKHLKINFKFPTNVSLDGEICRKTSMDVTILYKAIKLSLPQKCDFLNK